MKSSNTFTTRENADDSFPVGGFVMRKYFPLNFESITTEASE